jgi:hypothetical protein
MGREGACGCGGAASWPMPARRGEECGREREHQGAKEAEGKHCRADDGVDGAHGPDRSERLRGASPGIRRPSRRRKASDEGRGEEAEQ